MGASRRAEGSMSMSAAEHQPLTLDELRRLPAESLLPVGFLLRVAEAELTAARAAQAAVPPPDASAGDLAKRYAKSRSRIREWIVAGEFGEPSVPGGPYRAGPEWRVPWAAVLARDERKRAGSVAAPGVEAFSVPVANTQRGKGRGSLRELMRQRLA